jgi:NAD dependent epimerase/dehydratase
MDLSDKKILITGADGFIGSHLTERLIDLGYNVRALTYYNSFSSYGWIDTFSSEKLAKLEVFPGDIRDPSSVRNAMKDCEIIFHLAALIAIPYSYTAPDSYIDTNVKGTLNILNAARDLNVKKIIVTSTSETYGTAKYVPIDESHPMQGQSPYSASKIGADQLAWSFFNSFSLPITILRPFNTYGPRQSARAIIPTIISQILSKQKEIRVGSLYPTRDFTFVLDTVEGFIKMAKSDNNLGEFVNIGMNEEISIGDLIKKIQKLTNNTAPIIEEDQRKRPEKSEVYRLWADNTKAKSLIGWEPKYTLDDGLKKTIEWFSIPDNLKQYKANIYNK